MNAWAKLATVARRHHYVVSGVQAAACGLDPATLWRRATSERWERLHPGVYALPGSAATHERQISAALLAVGGKVAACRQTAAYLWGMTDRVPSVVDLVIPPSRRAPALEGVRALRSRTVTPSDLRCVDGLAVTSPARTICDLAAVILDDHELRLLVLAARRRGVLDLAELRRRHMGLARSRGGTRLARILNELDAERPGSIFEHEIRAFVHSHGLVPHPTPLWIPCRDGRTRQVDIPFIDQWVGIDADDGTRVDEDDEKDLELAAVGWRIGRLTRPGFQRDRERWLQSLLRLLASSPPLLARQRRCALPAREKSAVRTA
ncbi:MAG: type IV toxin-antitoxin system AbiEi family antitoxin domain-containing protein [Egibacteraceae bacterium]